MQIQVCFEPRLLVSNSAMRLCLADIQSPQLPAWLCASNYGTVCIYWLIWNINMDNTCYGEIKKKVYVNAWMENIVLWISGLCTCYVCFDKPALTFCYGNILHCGLSWYKIIIIHVGFFLKLLIRILHNASLRELLIIMWIEKLIISFLFLAENLNNSKVRINWLLGAMCCNF